MSRFGTLLIALMVECEMNVAGMCTVIIHTSTTKKKRSM